MEYQYSEFNSNVHRLIPSRYPPVGLFDWAKTQDEVEEIAALEGLTNDRLVTEYGDIHLVAKHDWVSGNGATPLLAVFNHPGESRFSDGTYGIYYAGDSLTTAVVETKFHRERFLNASKEAPCLIQMREYITKVLQKLVDISEDKYQQYLNPNPEMYRHSQDFGHELRSNNEWGVLYPSVRNVNSRCVAIFRPPAVSIPVQGCHLDYVWDGQSITEVKESKLLPL